MDRQGALRWWRWVTGAVVALTVAFSLATVPIGGTYLRYEGASDSPSEVGVASWSWVPLGHACDFRGHAADTTPGCGLTVLVAVALTAAVALAISTQRLRRQEPDQTVR